MGKVFSAATTVLLKSAMTKGELVNVKLGASGSPRQYLLIDGAGGSQPFRTQYDMALDGSQFVLTAGKGIGTYEFKLLEGPVKDCGSKVNTSKSSFVSDYKKMDDADSRRLTIVTKTDSSTTKNSLTFRGIINQVAINAARGEDGESYVIIIVSATGIWT